MITKWIFLESTRKKLLENVQDRISKLLGGREIKKNKSVYSFAGHPVRTRIPAKRENDKVFRKHIWERINKRVIKGKISEEKDGKD